MARPLRVPSTPAKSIGRQNHFEHVELDFGGMVPGGLGGGSTLTTDRTKPAVAPPGTYSSFSRDSGLTINFALGYLAGRRAVGSKSSIDLEMTVSNSLSNTASLGRGWANAVKLAQTALIFAELTGEVFVQTGNDIEGGFSAPRPVFNWLSGYQQVTHTPLVNAGAVDGCPTSGTTSKPGSCATSAGNWTQQDYWRLSFTAPGSQFVRYAFPQIYCYSQAKEWQQVSLYGALGGAGGVKGPLRFTSLLAHNIGDAGYYQACTGKSGPPPCPNAGNFICGHDPAERRVFMDALNSNQITRQPSIPEVQLVSSDV